MLTDTDDAILELEAGWWKYAAAKESRIREVFGWSPTRYYQRLNVLIDDPAAMEAHPLTVRRLLRLREARRSARSKRLG